MAHYVWPIISIFKEYEKLHCILDLKINLQVKKNVHELRTPQSSGCLYMKEGVTCSCKTIKKSYLHTYSSHPSHLFSQTASDFG